MGAMFINVFVYNEIFCNVKRMHDASECRIFNSVSFSVYNLVQYDLSVKFS